MQNETQIYDLPPAVLFALLLAPKPPNPPPVFCAWLLLLWPNPPNPPKPDIAKKLSEALYRVDGRLNVLWKECVEKLIHG
jgi:hypothetical protein